MDNNIPATVVGDRARGLYERANDLRARLKALVADADQFRKDCTPDSARVGLNSKIDPEVIANATLALRHAEDASLRYGKVLQHLDGGVSVYDPKTVAGPDGRA